MAAKLRLISDQDFLDSNSVGLSAVADSKVTVAVKDALPLLLHAYRSNRQWLQDFSDDTLDISSDLYEVLLAYQQMQQEAA